MTVYVDLIGSVTEETAANLKDNFALAANKEKPLKPEIPAEEADGMCFAPEDRVNIR